MKNLFLLYFLFLFLLTQFQLSQSHAEYLVSLKEGHSLSESQYKQVMETLYLYSTPTSLFFQKEAKLDLTAEERLELQLNEESFIKRKLNEKFSDWGVQIQFIPDTLYELFYLTRWAKQFCTSDPKEILAFFRKHMGAQTGDYLEDREEFWKDLRSTSFSFLPLKLNQYRKKMFEPFQESALEMKRKKTKSVGAHNVSECRIDEDTLFIKYVITSRDNLKPVEESFEYTRNEHLQDQLDSIYSPLSYELNQMILREGWPSAGSHPVQLARLQELARSLLAEMASHLHSCKVELESENTEALTPYREQLKKLVNPTRIQYLTKAIADSGHADH